MATSVTDALSSARATVADEQLEVDELVLDLVRRTRRASAPRRVVSLRGVLVAVVGVPLAGLALTGAAVTVDSTLHPDVVIPVHYVTDTGVAHDCTIYIEGGSVFAPGSTVIGDELKTRDWTGVGQRMYTRALELSQALASSTTMSPADRDAWAWSSAESQLTVLDLQGITLPEGEHAVSVSDCTGELH